MPETTTPQPDALESLLPARMLQPGETILLQRKPSPLYIVLAPAGFLLLVLGLAAAGLHYDHHYNYARLRTTLLIAALSLLFLRLGWQCLDWLARVYVLTDRRVIRLKGVVRVRAFECRLEHVQHTQLLLTLRERLFGLGTVAFSTAGTGAVEAGWVYLADPLDVHAKVVEALQSARR